MSRIARYWFQHLCNSKQSQIANVHKLGASVALGQVERASTRIFVCFANNF